MPEAPEVKMMHLKMQEFLTGEVLKSVNIVSGRYAKSPIKGIELFKPGKITNVECRGKFIYLNIEDTFHIHCTMGMSGIWTTVPIKHIRFEIETQSGKKMFFSDVRNFGTISFCEPEKTQEKLSRLGVDLLSIKDEKIAIMLGKTALKRVTNPNYNITRVLMDQEILSGVGNYIKCEALYRAKISPFKNIGDLSDSQIEKLIESCWHIMQQSLKANGATFKNYMQPNGKAGSATFTFSVYGKKHDFFGNAVITQKTPDKRTTYWCPKVQQ